MKSINTIIFFNLMSFICFNSWAQNQQLTHQTCQIHLKISDDKDMDALLDTATKELRKRGFSSTQSDFTKPLGKDQLYLNIVKEIESEGFYPPCRTTIILQQTKTERVLTKDQELYRYSSRRSVPRTTPKSLARCHLAVHDAFGFFPTCLINKADIEKVITD